MIEEWRDIKNYEGVYQISSLGRIRSLDRYVDDKGHKRFVKGKILKPSKHKNDYEYVVLYDRKHKLVHQLVAKNFIPNPENKRTVNHINGDKSDNRVINLEWCNGSYNIRDMYERKGKYKNDYKIIQTYKNLKSCSKVGKIFNMSGENIRQILIRNNIQRNGVE